MQFGCESCKAQLQIADEKVRGKRLIVRCKRCGAKIAISDPLLAGSQAPRLVSAAPPAASRPPPSHPAPSPRPVSRPSPAVARAAQPDPDSTRAMESDVLEKALQASRDDASARNGVPASPVSQPPPAETPAAPESDEAIWFAMIHGRQTGPLTATELAGRTMAGDVGPRTYLWREGMESWQRARDLAEVAALFAPPPASDSAPTPKSTPAVAGPETAAPEAAPSAEQAAANAMAHDLFPSAENKVPPRSALDLARWATDELSKKKDSSPAPAKAAARLGTMFENAAPVHGRGPFPVFIVLLALAAAAIVLWMVIGAAPQKSEAPAPAKSAAPSPPAAPVQTAPAAPKPAEPPPKAAAAPAPAPATPTGLTAEQVRKRLDENKAALQGCVDEALRTDPKLRVGKIHIATTIAPSGQVTSARIDRRSVEDTPLGACLRKATRRIAFPAFSGEAFDVDIPIVVSAGE